jgi:hypothetical protein
MEHFFTPTQRLPIELDAYTGVQLAVSIEAFLNHRWDWLDFQAFATSNEGETGKIVWITEDTFICVDEDNTGMEYERLADYAIQSAAFTATSGKTHHLVFAKEMNSVSMSVGAFNIFWRAVTTSNCVKVKLKNEYSCRGLCLCSGPSLSHFLEASPSLELLEFEVFAFNKADCCALATLERKGLEVTFEECSFDAQGAEDTFIEWLRDSQVVTKIGGCVMGHSIIISAMSGNSSVKKMSMGCSFDAFTGEYGDCHTRSLAGVLPGNQGIENLSVTLLSDETWSLLLRSLRAHPRIQYVRLDFCPGLSAASKTSMMNAVFRFAQCNTVVHTIDLPDYAKDEEFFQNSIVPRLEMNRNCFEDQRQALTRAHPSIRGQLLGRALHVVRYNPDLLFRFLSENIPAFVRSEGDDPTITSGQKRKARP